MTSSYSEAFDSLPDDARLWVYTTDRDLTSEEQRSVLQGMDEFIRSWTSHERPVTARVCLLEKRVLLLGAVIPGGELSGCGIDKSTRLLDDLSTVHAFVWLSNLHLVCRDEEGTLRVLSRTDFQRQVTTGLIDSDTIVLDTTVQTVGDYRKTGVFRKAGETWHAAAFHPGTHGVLS